MTTIIGLAGSLRSGSSTRAALKAALMGSAQGGAAVRILELDKPILPPFDGEASQQPEVLQFREHVRGADALLIATPVYNDSFSGVLKNALDHLQNELHDKLVGLIAVGGGRFGQGQALEHLRSVLRATNTWVLPRQVVIANSKEVFDGSGNVIIEELKSRLLLLGREVVVRSKLMARKPADTAR